MTGRSAETYFYETFRVFSESRRDAHRTAQEHVARGQVRSGSRRSQRGLEGFYEVHVARTERIKYVGRRTRVVLTFNRFYFFLQSAEDDRSAGPLPQRLSDRGRAEDARQTVGQPRHQTAFLSEAEYSSAAEIELRPRHNTSVPRGFATL